MVKKEFILETDSHNHDCDDCGWYVDDEVTVTFPNGKKLTLISDGHFGGGDWSGQFKDVYLLILDYLGVRVSFDGYEEKFFLSDEKTIEYEKIRTDVKVVDSIDVTIEDVEVGQDMWISNGRIESDSLGSFEFVYQDHQDLTEFDASYESLLRIYLEKVCSIIEH